MGPIPMPISSRSTSRSSNATARAIDPEQMEELVKVKRELEEALRQVKKEIKQGGGPASDTSSACGRSTARSMRSDVSGSTTSTYNITDWEAWGRGKKKGQLNTGRR